VSLLPETGPRRDLALALLLLLAAAAFRFPRLWFPPEEIFDEVYHATAALSYLRGEMPVEWVHPPTSKILISFGVALFGYDSWGWRLAPAVCGTLLAPIFFFLARRVLPSERAAVLASLLLVLDGVYLVQSRTAMTNIFAVLFQVLAALCLVRVAGRDRLSVPGMLLLGLSLGLALSSRWTSLWATGFLGLALLAARRTRIFRPREILLTCLAFAVLPACIYVAAYWYYPAIRPTSLEHLWNTQKGIWNYHATLNATHAYFSPWYTWPWLVRPTWYYYKHDAANLYVYGIVALGNPALWWASVPVSLAALVTGARARDWRRLFAGMGFALLYLPWGLSPRTLNFSHYLFEALPYACLSLGYFVDRGLASPRWRGPAVAYVTLAALLFLFFVPILTAYPLPLWLFNNEWLGRNPWLWFSTWV
jgi:dolichyl-phosphate-mannose--protein O-mannosyl transferase